VVRLSLAEVATIQPQDGFRSLEAACVVCIADRATSPLPPRSNYPGHSHSIIIDIRKIAMSTRLRIVDINDSFLLLSPQKTRIQAFADTPLLWTRGSGSLRLTGTPWNPLMVGSTTTSAHREGLGAGTLLIQGSRPSWDSNGTSTLAGPCFKDLSLVAMSALSVR
jgi:hypothetical protein